MRRIKKERRLLTGSNNRSPASTSLRTSSAKSQDVAQPAKGDLPSATVKVGSQGTGSLELAQLASIRWVTDGKDRLEPARAGCDGTTVHPNIEAGAAAVSTVTTLTNTTERQGWNVEGSVVAGDTTRAGGTQN